MSKPIRKIKIKTRDGKENYVKAVLDTGSYYTIIREGCVPNGATIIKLKKPEIFGTANKSGKLHITASMDMILMINGHPISDQVLISPDLKGEFILGAKTMQAWDIGITNKNGRSLIHVGRDMNDPDIQIVL